MVFTFEDLVKIYEKKRDIHGSNTYKYISEILDEAKVQHMKHFTGNDHEQSWRAFKGKNLEKLVAFVLKPEVQKLGLDLVQGNVLERNSKSLAPILDRVKRNLLVDFGQYGMHLPDIDIIIFRPADSKVLAVVSVKVTLRERIAQTGYWKLKLGSAVLTRDIKVYFVTPDEDGALTTKNPMRKGRAIVETDTDGSYVMNEEIVEESEYVKTFDKFMQDLINIMRS